MLLPDLIPSRQSYKIENVPNSGSDKGSKVRYRPRAASSLYLYSVVFSSSFT